MTTVRLEALSKHFGSTVAVDGIDVDIASGELVALLGPSGCGKTTTLRMVAGLEQPTSGHIIVGDQVVVGEGRFVRPEHRDIGMVFQSYAVWPHLTVFENVAYPLRVRRLGREAIARLTRTALDAVQLGTLAERYPRQLSGGQQQRVSLARAIVFEPRILLLDEPLSNLDAKLREEMRFEIRRLQQRLGITALFVTHDQQEAFALSDRVAVMRAGRVLQFASPKEIFDSPADAFVANFVGWTRLDRGQVVDRTQVLIQGHHLSCEVPANVSDGSMVDVYVRPERIRIVPATADEGTLPGRVVSVAFLGVVQAVEIEHGGGTLVARDALGTALHPGMEIGVSIPPADIRVFPA